LVTWTILTVTRTIPAVINCCVVVLTIRHTRVEPLPGVGDWSHGPHWLFIIWCLAARVGEVTKPHLLVGRLRRHEAALALLPVLLDVVLQHHGGELPRAVRQALVQAASRVGTPTPGCQIDRLRGAYTGCHQLVFCPYAIRRVVGLVTWTGLAAINWLYRPSFGGTRGCAIGCVDHT
jgi:hypothetical protein